MRTTIRLVASSLSLGVVLVAGVAAAGPLDGPGAAKALACSACHGPGGQSPSNTMPIIAGIAPWYFKKAIEDYAAGRRPSPEMEPYAKYVIQAGVDDLAAYFTGQARQPTVMKSGRRGHRTGSRGVQAVRDLPRRVRQGGCREG